MGCCGKSGGGGGKGRSGLRKRKTNIRGLIRKSKDKDEHRTQGSKNK